MEESKPKAPLLQELNERHLEIKDCLTETDRIDTPAELLELERRHAALTYIQKSYSLPNLTAKERALAPIINPMHGVDQIGNQFAIKLLGAYLTEDSETALEIFRQIEPSTAEQELALLANDDQFRGIHDGLHMHLAAESPRLVQAVTERLDPKSGQIAINDRLQFNNNETYRSLREVLRRGISVEIDPKALDQILTAREKVGTGPLPLTEVLKNERILSINGFADSKISVAVHDAMDHTWGFILASEKGLLEKFSAFWDSIGNPAYTDIFRREGEIVASIAFGVRYASTQENGFVPLVNVDSIRKIFEDYFDNGILEERHMAAFRILRSITPNSHEWHSLGFSYSNYIAELDEQRRKHGKIKVRHLQTREVIGELSEVNPDFLSLFVELHHEILSSKNKHRDDLFRFHILFEEYLQAIANGDTRPDQIFNVKVQDLSTYAYDKTTVPPERLRWMAKNYGFTAAKHELF